MKYDVGALSGAGYTDRPRVALPPQGVGAKESLMKRILSSAVAGLAAVLAAVPVATATPMKGPPVVVSGHGIGAVRFGLPRKEAVAKLTLLLGQPSQVLVNSGCGPRYREVAWSHLYVEFRLGRFTGFRYMERPWLPQTARRKPMPSPLLPKLATAKAITLGSTLRDLRTAYTHLNVIGTDRWQAPDGLVFYDNARRQPPPASSQIVEIKFGTCGDF